LLASDIIGLQTLADCANFLDTVETSVDADIDHHRQAVFYQGHVTRIRAYPVGVEWNNDTVRTTPPVNDCRKRTCCDFGLPPGVRLGVGVDRLDYTKGINYKFLAIERLLEINPDLRGRFVFIQVAEPSRDCLPEYQRARAELHNTRDRVNARFATGKYLPIVLLETHHDAADVYRLYRAADLCYVGSLRDGMNLVAKEFVCARDDLRGVLVLSEFAGAARQLRTALTINPYDVEQAARILSTALMVSDAEQESRMRALRANVAKYDAHWWAQQLVDEADLASAKRSDDSRRIAIGRPATSAGVPLDASRGKAIASG
jgi:trehalose 6-phosphate synthase